MDATSEKAYRLAVAEAGPAILATARRFRHSETVAALGGGETPKKQAADFSRNSIFSAALPEPLRRPMPPFARDFVRRPKDSSWIFAGPKSWEWARFDGRRKLVLPPAEDPASYKWPVAGLEIIVLDTGADDGLLMRLAHVLLHSGATLVGVIPHKVPRTGGLAIFTSETRHAA